jgi:Glycosyltransferase family 87
MGRHYILRSSFWLPLAAAVCAAGMWLYTQRVLVAYQIADAVTHGRPRGNFSDLYPRWVGARELLLYGHDPYSAETTREIQSGYYGRPLEPWRSEDPKDQQAFAYPVYVAFYLAPTLRLPFEAVRRGFFWILVALTCTSVLLWLRVLQCRVSLWLQASMLMLTLGSVPLMQGLKLQQITLLVAALVAVALALLVADYPIPAGIVLALATIKPQLVWLLLLWLVVWTATAWRRRFRWAVAFVVTMAILFVASELFLPRWIPRFWHALHEYRDYTGGATVLQSLLPLALSRVLEVLLGLVVAIASWNARKQEASSDDFVRSVCRILAMTVLVIPTNSPYNQVLLLPAVLMLARDWPAVWRKTLAARVLLLIGTALLAWPWIAGIGLVVISFLLPPASVQENWAVPFWTVLLVPVTVTVLALLDNRPQSFAGSAERIPS